MRRVELAQVVSRVLTQRAADRPSAARRPIADVPAEHLSYPAISAAVGVRGHAAAGRRRLPARRAPVSGAEAVDVVGRLESLANEVAGHGADGRERS